VRALRRLPILVAVCTVQGCVVSTVVSTAADVGVAVVEAPIKAGKAVYDAATSDKKSKNQDDSSANDSNGASGSTAPAGAGHHP